VAVGDCYIKLQYFEFVSVTAGSGKKYKIFNDGVSDIISDLGSIIPWMIGKKVPSKLLLPYCIALQFDSNSNVFAEPLKSWVLTQTDHANILQKLHIGMYDLAN
jgi:hypothetical protein